MRIGELAERVGLRPSAIRFYEASGLLPAGPRGLNGYRDYDDASVKRVQLIQLAQRLGFSLDGLRRLFAAGQGELPREQVLESLAQRRAEIARLRAELDAQDAELAQLAAACQTAWSAGACLDLGPAAPAAAPRRRGSVGRATG